MRECVAYCPELRESGLMEDVLRAVPRVSGYDALAQQCPDGTEPVGGLSCLNTTDPHNTDANMFRCNLRCLNRRAHGSEALMREQCEQLGDATCEFAQVDCATTMAAARARGAVDDERGATADVPIATATRDSIMSSAFQKTLMMREVLRGALDGRDAAANELVELGREPRVRQFLLNPTLDATTRERVATALVEEMPTITSIHDACCRQVGGGSFESAADARREIDKMAAVSGLMEADPEYDPTRRCPGSDALVRDACPFLHVAEPIKACDGSGCTTFDCPATWTDDSGAARLWEAGHGPCQTDWRGSTSLAQCLRQHGCADARPQ